MKLLIIGVLILIPVSFCAIGALFAFKQVSEFQRYEDDHR